MQGALLPPLVLWQNFYVIMGSAAATLTGLMFVVITLIAGARRRISSSGGAIAAFSTPNVVHFGMVLLVAALLSAPWQVLWNVALLLGLVGLTGVSYVLMVLRRARRQKDYQPVLEDWLWHTVFPLISYTALVIAAIVLLENPALALFFVGAALVLLLFIGIHNAWDNVTYLILYSAQLEDKPQDQ